MKISNEAIEAAAMALLAVTPDVWALQTTGTKDRYRWDAQAALQAAAPHMLSEAWGEGYGAGWNDCLLDLQNGGAKMTRNPYRSQA